MVLKKEIIYPIFLECCQFTQDNFWLNVFEELSYGTTPYGTYISKDYLCCNYKEKEFCYKIEKKDPENVYKDIYNLLSNKLGLLSNYDKKLKKINFNNLQEDLKYSREKWTNIRKKNIKDLLIENYCINMRQKYLLDITQTRYLFYLIYIAIVFKVIGVKDIEYNNGVIENIDGITIKRKEIVIERDIYALPIHSQNFRKVVIVENKLMSDNWAKYITGLKKH